jgi:TusA-related sulfurtransferase
MAKRSMAGLPAGSVVVVLATDPEAPVDLAAWAVDEGYVFRERGAGEYEIEKKS